MIAVFTTLVGATQMMVGPPLVAAMVDVVPPQDRPRAFSLEFWALNLGTMIAAPLAGLLANAGFTPLFLVEAAATATTLAILALKVPETLPPRTGDDNAAGLRTVLTDRIWMTFIGLTFVLAILGQMTITTPTATNCQKGSTATNSAPQDAQAQAPPATARSKNP